MHSRATVIDFYSFGKYHEVINQGFLMMIALIYDEVIYIAERTACENLKRLLSSCDVKIHNVIFVEKNVKKIRIKHPGLRYCVQIFKVSFFNFIYYCKSKKKTDVFFNNNLFCAIPLIKFFAFWKKNRIFDVCHNEMEYIDWNVAKKHKISSLMCPIFLFNFKWLTLPQKLVFILLSDWMADYFKAFVPQKNKKQIVSIDHCYIRPPKAVEEIDDLPGSVKIGFPGAIAVGRGAEMLAKLLPLVNNEMIQFFSISSLCGVVDETKIIRLNPDNKLLPFERYNAYVNQMDYLAFFYNKDSYRLTASGAVLEAIWNEKPIIALHNAYFDYLFDKFGPMGILCESVEEMAQYVNSIKFVEKAGSYKKNLRNAKEMLLPQNVAVRLKEIINKY